MKRTLQIILPILVLLGGLLLGKAIVDATKPPERKAAVTLPPLVRAHQTHSGDLRIDVRTQGTVEARAEVDLAPRVSGRVVAVSPALRNGGFFTADELLVHIEETDFRLQIVQREAGVAAAQLRLAQEQAEAEAAIAAWQRLEGDRPPDDLATRKFQMAEARAALEGARAALEQAGLDLARTRLSLPFAGRVRAATIEVGQLVMAGQAIARTYPIDVVEVRLPIPDRDVEFLDLPLHFAGGGEPGTGPEVVLEAEFGGHRHRWTGLVDRTEGEIDRRTRQIAVVARVTAPFAAGEDPRRPPLAVGMFVQATIRGRVFPAVVEIPRGALRQGRQVLVIDTENRLRLREVQVLRLERDTALLSGGLADGERVCLTTLEAFTAGMPVRIAGDASSDPDPITADPADGGTGR